MPDIMTRNDFGALLTPIHKKIFFDSYNEVERKYPLFFKMDTMNKKDQTYPHLGAFGLWSQNQEGNSFNESDFEQGEIASFEAKRFDNSYRITWELMQDDQYGVMRGIGKGGSAQGLGRSLRATEETSAANVIKNGFSNVGYDGKPLFATDHPLISSSAKVSNVLNLPLTDENLKKALTMMSTQVDEANVFIAASAKQLVVCPELEFQAKAIVNSILQSGTDYNDVNTVPNLKIVVDPYLSDPTGLTKIWFVQDTTIDNLLFLRREAPIFDSERLEGKMDYRMFGYTRYDVGYCDWRGLVGSKGVQETITVPDVLGTLTIQVAAGSTSTTTKVTSVTGNGTGTLKYKVGADVTKPSLNDADTGYTALTQNTDITVATGDKIVVVESVDGQIKKSSEPTAVVVGE